jgi:hypothetical protein
MSGAGKIAASQSQARKATKEAEPTRKVSGCRLSFIESRAKWRNISVTLKTRSKRVMGLISTTTPCGSRDKLVQSWSLNPMPQNHRNDKLPHLYDRALMLHGSKRNEVLTLAEIKRYGLDNFADADYISIYGMHPEEWYRHGIRVIRRTAVECTRDALGDRVGLDVASVAKCMPSNEFAVIDPFAGSCNTLFWILRHLTNSEGIGFESDQQVFALTHRNLAVIGQRIDLVHGRVCNAPWGAPRTARSRYSCLPRASMGRRPR